MGLVDDVDDVFKEGGTLAEKLGAQHRPEQREMALAVARAFTRKTTLLAEAGTGTGKTFAYCVPALLSGQKTIISTATKNLQDQIAQRDLPRLINALGVNAKVSVLKGRANYLCWHRLGRAKGVLDEIREWSHTTETGDRAELKVLPDDYMPWKDIDARGETCLGHGCAFYAECFVTRARQKAAASEIVVVNHHLFFADLSLRQHPQIEGGILPRYDAVVFDEAHAIEDVVTEHFGVSFSDGRLRDLVKDTLDALQETKVAGIETLEQQLGELPMMAGRLFHGMNEGPGSRALRPPEPAVLAQVHALSGALERLSEIVEDLGKGAVWDAISDRSKRLAHDLSFVFAPDERYAHTIEQRAKSHTVRALPLDVAGILGEHLFKDAPTTIMTSATLSVAGDFGLVRARHGIETAEEIVVASPFDYKKNALLFVPPATFPEPSQAQDAVTQMLAQLVKASQGGALLLFTSLQAMHTQHERLLEAFLEEGLLVLKQGQAPKHALLERFASDGSCVLFASQSFFEGVDVPGHALRLVVVDKLPFVSPTDPLLAARIAEAEKRGERTFDTYQLAGAVLSLRQAFGRLIRTPSDRGVVSILDSRLRTRAYGRKFLKALPPAPLTADVGAVENFFVSAKGPDRV